jgi:hypothetical protein
MSARDPLLRHSSTTLRYPEWQRPYQAALLEVDPKRPADRVAEAEAAIFGRLEQLSEISGSQDGKAEHHAIHGAIYALKMLKRESVNFPD